MLELVPIFPDGYMGTHESRMVVVSIIPILWSCVCTTVPVLVPMEICWYQCTCVGTDGKVLVPNPIIHRYKHYQQ